jgi:TFIIF-interacting CTD phosphatase-like protein
MFSRKLLHSLSGLEQGSSTFRIALVLSENSSWTQRKSYRYLYKPSRDFSSGTLNHQYNKKLVSKKLVPTREYDSDLVVVLDLDECLIHSQFVKGHAGANYAHQVFRSDHDQSPDEKSSSVNTFKISLPDGELVRVHERPYLQEFLQNVSEKNETHLSRPASKSTPGQF